MHETHSCDALVAVVCLAGSRSESTCLAYRAGVAADVTVGYAFGDDSSSGPAHGIAAACSRFASGERSAVGLLRFGRAQRSRTTQSVLVGHALTSRERRIVAVHDARLSMG